MNYVFLLLCTMTSLFDLPLEMITRHIFTYLNRKEQRAMRIICRHKPEWRNARIILLDKRRQYFGKCEICHANPHHKKSKNRRRLVQLPCECYIHNECRSTMTIWKHGMECIRVLHQKRCVFCLNLNVNNDLQCGCTGKYHISCANTVATTFHFQTYH